MATDLIPAGNTCRSRLAEVGHLVQLADETPEGRSIVFCEDEYGVAGGAAREELVPFTAQTRMSGVDLPGRTGDPKGRG